MATDCEKLSANAQSIFERLKPHFPPDPWNKPQWHEDGRVYDNGWYDLRLSVDRDRLMEMRRRLLGSLVEIQAGVIIKRVGSLARFTYEHFTSHMQEVVELIRDLNELDFQIETLDLIES